MTRLRVLVANERHDRLELVAALVAGLGHDVIAPQIEVSEFGAVTARTADVAFVGLGESSQHALELIEQIVNEAACPVVALLHEPDPAFVVQAARRGVFASSPTASRTEPAFRRCVQRAATLPALTL